MQQMKNSCLRGQIAFEFLIIYSLFIFLFVAAMWAVTERATYSQFRAEQIFARETAARFADEINLAARFPGYQKTYIFPSTLRGMHYDLTVRDGMLLLNYTTITDISFFQPLTTRSVVVVGSPEGRIDTAKGRMSISNNAATGQVVIS